MSTTTNALVPSRAVSRPTEEHTGRGAMSYTPRGYWTGHLPYKLAERFHEAVQRDRFVPTIYSYGTPIAWKEGDAWIVPAVSYSMTTAKHQSYLHGGWQRIGLPNIEYVPADVSREEIDRVAAGLMTFGPRYGTMRTLPGRNAA